MNYLNIGVLYLSLHNQLVKKFGINAVVPNKKFFEKIGKHNQIPRNLRYVVLKEMEDKGLIRKVNRDNIELVNIKTNIEQDCKEIYQSAKMF